MEASSVKEKKLAALASIISNSILILLKFVAGIVSGSIGIISEAVHSSSDLLASSITYFSVAESSKPADEDHQFGHGKYEDFTSFIEGILIILAALYIIYEALKKILFSIEPEINADIGLLVMLFSIFANFCVSKYLFKTAHKTGSTALYADGEHLRTDMFSSLAVLTGLFLVKITGIDLLDSIAAILVAVIIFGTGYKICSDAGKILLDTSLSENENSQIREIIAENIGNQVIGIKNLRTRKVGLIKNIELTLIVERTMHISTSHALCDKIEAEIDNKLKNTDIIIHLEPN